jgi:hypothetical protein
MRKALFLLLSAALSTLASRAEARAPDTFEEHYAEPIIIESPMWFAFELRLGPFRPSYGVFKDVFQSDKGWLLNTEFDITAYHVPYVGQLNVGLGWGWANYEARAPVVPGTSPSGENTSMIMYPMSLMAVLRVDALARKTVIPLTFAGKLGYDFVRYKLETGSTTDDAGVNMGLRWGAQVAFELDIIDRKSARRLDDDFEINHTFVLFEYFGSLTEGTGGDSFQFGLGLQF